MDKRIVNVAKELWRICRDEKSDFYDEDYASDWTYEDVVCSLDEYVRNNGFKELDRGKLVERRKVVDEDFIFGDIDTVTANLQKLKAEGWTEILQKWYGYEDNEFVAIRYEAETEDEYYERIHNGLDKYLIDREKKKQKKAEAEAEIKRLKARIRQLESDNKVRLDDII